MADSPTQGSEGVVRLTVLSNGTALGDTIQFTSVSIDRALARVPSAQLIIIDGDMPNQAFPISDSADFKPGAMIRINAGYGDVEETIFEGVVVKHSMRISGNNESRLLVECRDQAMKMTIGRLNANHVDKTDSDIIAALINGHGLSADVEATTVQNKELVQFNCTDWDFMLSRADANGLLVIVTDGKVAVKSPAVADAPELKVTYGQDLMEFQAEIDARTQFSSAQAVSWDMKAQAVVLGSEAAPARLNAQGDLDSATLASVVGLSSYRLQTGTATPKEALTQWAKAQQVKSGLARIRGRMSFCGSAKASVGALIELEGVGSRFSGKVFVTALTHKIENGAWVTEVSFGQSPEWFTERADVSSPGAAGLLPAVDGLQVGVVMKLDADPEGENRIQVAVPVMQAQTEGVWARLTQFHNSDGIGAFFVPEIGDEVVLGYFNNDPSHPVILGSLYSSKRPPPYSITAENNIKAIVTRCKSKIEFDEENKIITLKTPGNNRIVISDKDKSIVLHDQNDNQVKLDPAGITLDSPKDIKLTAKGSITVDAVGAVTITSKADVKAAGLNINCEAKVGFVGKGNASAELSAAGQTTVKGAMVMIN